TTMNYVLQVLQLLLLLLLCRLSRAVKMLSWCWCSQWCCRCGPQSSSCCLLTLAGTCPAPSNVNQLLMVSAACSAPPVPGQCWGSSSAGRAAPASTARRLCARSFGSSSMRIHCFHLAAGPALDAKCRQHPAQR
ncbi:hypothetical protein COO60DRAFT_1494061, partial [Scenedesmus sp. NREL 46B-D3]